MPVKFKSKLKDGKLLGKVKSQITRAVKAAVEAGEKQAKSVVPVDTGELRDSIATEVNVAPGLIVGKVKAGDDAITLYAPIIEIRTGFLSGIAPVVEKTFSDSLERNKL
jgi:hypothetical protein